MSNKLLGKIKKFDEVLFNKYDIPARDLMKEKLGEKVKDNPDIYGEDLIIDDPNLSFKFLELQVCAEWIGEKYPHPKPFVYERKGHFDDATLFILFDKHLTKALFFSKKMLNKEPKRKKKYSRFFIYEIEWKYVVEYYMENFSIDDLYLLDL